MSTEPNDWYKDAVVYELHVRAFCDGSGDGNGDFKGLLDKLPYLHNLGITCLWLLPFYPSPLRDDGYDIADYTQIHPEFGNMADFKRFLKEAHRLGMKVITELVVNHTSDQHAWFQAARKAPRGSSTRNWYVWSDNPDQWAGARIIFTDTEHSNWTWDAIAGQYYWHRFFGHQPDLNFEHPPVRKAIEKVMRFWLNLGVDGMRLDAIPYLFQREGTNCENLPETHEFIRHLRTVADEYSPERMLLAEANQWPEDVRAYFGEGDECHMAFHFPLMPRLFMALAQEDRHPIVEIMRRTPEIPSNCQWALFLRNHDELTLEMVSDKERDYMLKAYATHPRMRINVGIRRRLSSLVDNSRPRIELLTCLLFSMPGTPVLYYGDEIGMGDNIYLGDRNAVRTPMQWSADRNAGFSHCDYSQLYAPPIQDPIYHYATVNVENQQRDPSSLLVWTRKMLQLRSSSPAFGRGSIEFLEPSNRRILAYLRSYQGETILVTANLSHNPQPFSLDLAKYQGMVPVEMQGNVPFPQIGKHPMNLALGAWGWMWFKLRSSEVPPTKTLADLPLLEQEESGTWWRDRNVRLQLHSSLIPGWLPGCSWLQSLDGGTLESVSSIHLDEIGDGMVLATMETEFSDGPARVLRTLFCAVGEEEAEMAMGRTPNAAICRIRSPNGQILVVIEALTGVTGLLEIQKLLDGAASPGLNVTIAGPPNNTGLSAAVSVLGRHHIVGLPCGAILKWYHAGGPAAERSRRALAQLETTLFSKSPRLLGTINTRPGGELCGLLLEQIEHQGRLDERLHHELDAYLEAVGFRSQSPADAALPSMAIARELSVSINELHAHLGTGKIWTQIQRNLFAGSLRDVLMRAVRIVQPKGREAQKKLRDQLWSQATELMAKIPADQWRGEAHGDLHLGQILVRNASMVFLDFDGNKIDAETPLPTAFDLASISWSLWRLAHANDTASTLEARRFWLEQCLAVLLDASREIPMATNRELFELMLMRRWAEDLCSKRMDQEREVILGFLTRKSIWMDEVGEKLRIHTPSTKPTPR